MMVKTMTLSNGTKVMKNGTMKTKDGKTMTMKEGDVIYMDGTMGTMRMDQSIQQGWDKNVKSKGKV